MEILKTVLMIIFAIDCIALTAIVLMQEGKSAGLGTISGMADTYWGQNKGRSMEGALVKSTKFLAVLFIVLAAVLNLKVFAFACQDTPVTRGVFLLRGICGVFGS